MGVLGLGLDVGRLLAVARPAWPTQSPCCWPPSTPQCASTQCASHLPKVEHVETGESDTMTTPVYSAVATTGRNYRTSAEAQKRRAKRPLFSFVEGPEQTWAQNERHFWDTPSCSFQPTIPTLILGQPQYLVNTKCPNSKFNGFELGRCAPFQIR